MTPSDPTPLHPTSVDPRSVDPTFVDPTLANPVRADAASPEPERDRVVQQGLHPVVYGAIIALALWLIVSVWALFGTADYDGITLVVVTGLFTIAIAIPALLWRTWQRNEGDGSDQTSPSFREWRSGQFATWTGEHRGS